MDVTICIASQCPDGLARLLESIGRSKRPPDLALEIAVVHNASAPAAVASMHTGSEEHHEKRPIASLTDCSSCTGSACAMTPPRLPAESVVAV